MPLYEYRCRACGHQFELIQKFSDPPMDRCEKCGGAVIKLLSAPGLQFKGSGFYITDYARKEKETTPKSDSASKSEKPAAPASTSTTTAPAKESGSSGSSGSSGTGGTGGTGGSSSTPASTPTSKK
jgi:putative FmdB family regulatory protein